MSARRRPPCIVRSSHSRYKDVGSFPFALKHLISWHLHIASHQCFHVDVAGLFRQEVPPFLEDGKTEKTVEIEDCDWPVKESFVVAFLSSSHPRPDSLMSRYLLPRTFGHLPVPSGRFLAKRLCLRLPPSSRQLQTLYSTTISKIARF